MMTMTLWSLVLMIKPMFVNMFMGAPAFDLIGAIALLLFALALLLITEAVKMTKFGLASEGKGKSGG